MSTACDRAILVSMVEKTLKSIADAQSEATGKLARIALEYAGIYGRVVPLAQEPDFGEDAWASLEALIAVDEFERVGLQKEVMDWPAYRTALTAFEFDDEDKIRHLDIYEQREA